MNGLATYFAAGGRNAGVTPKPRGIDSSNARRSDDTDARMMPHGTTEKSSSHQST
jgi:hypothetical protein